MEAASRNCGCTLRRTWKTRVCPADTTRGDSKAQLTAAVAVWRTSPTFESHAVVTSSLPSESLRSHPLD